MKALCPPKRFGDSKKRLDLASACRTATAQFLQNGLHLLEDNTHYSPKWISSHNFALTKYWMCYQDVAALTQKTTQLQGPYICCMRHFEFFISSHPVTIGWSGPICCNVLHAAFGLSCLRRRKKSYHCFLSCNVHTPSLINC